MIKNLNNWVIISSIFFFMGILLNLDVLSIKIFDISDKNYKLILLFVLIFPIFLNVISLCFF